MRQYNVRQYKAILYHMTQSGTIHDNSTQYTIIQVRIWHGKVRKEKTTQYETRSDNTI